MSDSNNHKINYSATDIERYHAGKMSAKEMHDMERYAMDDPFLADAIEGYDNQQPSSSTDIANDLNELQQRLKERIEQPQRRNIIPLFKTSWFKIAAMIILVAGAGTFIYYLSNNLQSVKTIVVKNTTPMPKQAPENSVTNDLNVTDSTAIALNQDKKNLPSYKREKLNAKSEDALRESSSILKSSPANPAVPSIANKKSAQASIDSATYTFSTKRFEKKAEGKKADSNAGAGSYASLKKEKVFSGKVLNENNSPVPDLVVSAETKYKAIDAKTDSNGYFKFKAEDSTASVVINKVGFETARVQLEGNSKTKDIKLKEMDSSGLALNEVVVIGYGAKKKKTLTNIEQASPIIGMKSYNLYLQQNKKNPDSISTHGEVTVSFIVNENGELTDYKIEKSLSRLADNEAIRLIKEGPAWQGKKNKKLATTITIKF